MPSRLSILDERKVRPYKLTLNFVLRFNIELVLGRLTKKEKAGQGCPAYSDSIFNILLLFCKLSIYYVIAALFLACSATLSSLASSVCSCSGSRSSTGGLFVGNLCYLMGRLGNSLHRRLDLVYILTFKNLPTLFKCIF